MPTSNRNQTQRRQFLRAATISAVAAPTLLTSAHAIAAEDEQVQPTVSVSRHRIRELSLLTAAPLPKMAAFYRDVLEMNVDLSESKLIVQAGKTQITFTPTTDQTKPYYHFAFNIPENKIVSARNWLVKRTPLSITPESQRENGYADDIRPFSFWNSHSVFFWDPAGNILELICRHDLKNGSKGEFRSDEILYASEIGFVTEDVNDLASQIKSTFQLKQYRGGGDTFRAIGDETGLLILFKRGGTPIGARPGQSWQIFPTDVSVRPDITLKSKQDPHSIRTQ